MRFCGPSPSGDVWLKKSRCSISCAYAWAEAASVELGASGGRSAFSRSLFTKRITASFSSCCSETERMGVASSGRSVPRSRCRSRVSGFGVCALRERWDTLRIRGAGRCCCLRASISGILRVVLRLRTFCSTRSPPEERSIALRVRTSVVGLAASVEGGMATTAVIKMATAIVLREICIIHSVALMLGSGKRTTTHGLHAKIPVYYQ